MPTIYFVTNNVNKFREIAHIFDKEMPIIKLKMTNLTKIEIQSPDLIEIVRYAVENISRRFKEPFFVEDAGLFIDKLGGFPGPFSHYVYDTIGIDGILKLLESSENRQAHFKSIIGFWDGNEIKIFEGIVKGQITLSPRGSKGFGFDPIFIPNGARKTFAEMEIDEKNQYSHRAKAARKLIEYLRKLHLSTT